MTFRKAIWIGVGVGSAVTLFGAMMGSPIIAVIGIVIAIVLVPAAWIAFLIMGVRWVLTGDPKGTLATKDVSAVGQRSEQTYVVVGKDRGTGAPRTMSIRSASSREAAAAASDCGIEVQEIR